MGKIPWRRKGNPLQSSCLENPMDRGAWPAAIHGVAKSRARLSDFHSLSEYRCGASPHCRQDACLDTGAPPLSGRQRLGEARLTAQVLLPARAALSRLINLGGKAKICKRTGGASRRGLRKGLWWWHDSRRRTVACHLQQSRGPLGIRELGISSHWYLVSPLGLLALDSICQN